MTAYQEIVAYINTQIPTGNLLIVESKIANFDFAFAPLISAMPRQILQITDAEIILSDDTQTQVQGKITILNQAALPAVLLIKDGATIDVTLTAELKEGWTWTDTFTNLPGTYRPMATAGLFDMGKTLLVDFKYRDPRWILTNTVDDAKGFKQGLNFDATVLLSNFKSVISEFFIWTTTMDIEMSGSVHVFSQVELHPVIHLKMGSSVRDLLISPVVINCLQICIGTTDPRDSLLVHETFLEITGNAILDESTETFQQVTTVFAPGQHVYRIHGEAADDSLSLGNGLAKMADLLIKDDGSQTDKTSEFTLPESLSSIGDVHFQSFDVSIDFSARTLEYIGVRIGSSETWTIIPNMIQIKNLALDCLVYRPLEAKSRSLSMLLKGRLLLGSPKNGVELDVYARKDDGFSLYGNLPEGDTIDLKALASEYVSDSADIPNLDIYFLDFYAKPGSGAYSFAAGINSDWTIVIGGGKQLVFRNTTFRMERKKLTATESEIIAKLEVQLEIAGAWVTLNADNPAGDTGWSFKGHARTNDGVTVAAMLGALTDLFGFDDAAIPLPASIKQLSFRNPGVVFNTKAKHFALSCEIRIPIADKNAYPDGEVNVLLRFAYDFTNKAFFIGWSVASIDLANLPLIKDKMPPAGKLAIHHLQMNYASGVFTAEALALLNELNAFYFGAPAVPVFAKGLKMDGEIVIDMVQQRLSFPVDSDGNSVEPPVVAGGRTLKLEPAAGVIWFPIGKNVGPATFERIGVSYKDGVVALYLDAALKTGPLNIALLGLTVSIPLDRFSPQFNIQGLGLSYDDPRVEIGGSFLKGSLKYNEITYTAYSGAAYIKLPAAADNGGGTKKKGGLTILAMGSYILMDDPSLLVYAMLDKAIGGPSFFFITGLAVGFGYNRRLNLPPLYRLPEFPLISAVLNPSTSSSDIAIEMRKLAPYIPPARGEYFMAIGVKATTFKLVESFALLILSVADSFRFDVIGTSRVRLPPLVPGTNMAAQPEVVRLEVAFMATFDPDKGFLGLQGQLTPNSFLFSRNCRIAGGFAFFSWMSGKHAGDFVQTLGGYHPRFKRPGHYPVVPRASFNWQLDSRTYIKGSLYYALTPRTMMAGGQFEVVFQAGNFKAWYRVGADFLISWKPLTYDAWIRVNIGASYTFKIFGIRSTVSADVGANVHIWGPEFGGRATVKFLVFSFDVPFGQANPPVAKAISWSEFKESFLPADDEICSLSVMDGLVSRNKNAITTDLGTLNPKTFALAASSVIPAKLGNDDLKLGNEMFGIAPMGKNSAKLTQATLKVTILSGEKDVNAQFNFMAVKKNIPSALWGESLKSKGANEPELIMDVLGGYEITPATPPKYDVSPSIDITELLLELNKAPNANPLSWQNLPARQDHDLDEAGREAVINDSILVQTTNDNRLGVLGSLGITEPELVLSEDQGGAFLFAPRIEKVV